MKKSLICGIIMLIMCVTLMCGTAFAAEDMSGASLTLDPATMTYGDAGLTEKAIRANSTLVLNGTVVPESDYTLTFDGIAAVPTTPGTYEVAAVGTGTNYTGTTTTTAKLTINKAKLTVTADSKKVLAFRGIPAFTYTVSGLKGSDTFENPTITTTATDTQSMGKFDINISGGTLTNSGCYDVSYVKGTLEVYLVHYKLYIVNGGEGAIPEQSVYQNLWTYIDAGSRPGYTFTGWTCDTELDFENPNAVETRFHMPEHNVTVTANWEESKTQGIADSGGEVAGPTIDNPREPVKTGDESNIVLFALIAALSAAGIVICLKKRKV